MPCYFRLDIIIGMIIEITIDNFKRFMAAHSDQVA
jgi:hypothetical protein